LRKQVLEAALVYYREFIDLRSDDPAAQEELRDSKARVEQILADLAVLQGAGQLHLLSQPAVLADLRPSADQRARIAARLAEQRQKSFREFHRLTPEERGKRFLELARANQAALKEILTREQLHRLKQIALQFQGLAAFREPAVATALKLTAAQKKRLRALEAETWVGPPGPKAHQERLRAAHKQVPAVLTEGQAKQWREMTGKPFQGPRPFFLPPPGHLGPPGPFGPRP
jgi:hypothetical protein